MNQALLVTLAAGAVLVVVGLAAVLLLTVSGRRRLQTELDSARADVDALRARVDGLTRAPADDATSSEAARAGREYLITSLPEEAEPGSALAVPQAQPPTRSLSAGQFASVAVGESLVKVLSFGYGVRRALSAENRNRIRFEIRREVKRSRKQRRRDVREAKRYLRAEQRTDLTEDAA